MSNPDSDSDIEVQDVRQVGPPRRPASAGRRAGSATSAGCVNGPHDSNHNHNHNHNYNDDVSDEDIQIVSHTTRASPATDTFQPPRPDEAAVMFAQGLLPEQVTERERQHQRGGSGTAWRSRGRGRARVPVPPHHHPRHLLAPRRGASRRHWTNFVLNDDTRAANDGDYEQGGDAEHRRGAAYRAREVSEAAMRLGQTHIPGGYSHDDGQDPGQTHPIMLSPSTINPIYEMLRFSARTGTSHPSPLEYIWRSITGRGMSSPNGRGSMARGAPDGYNGDEDISIAIQRSLQEQLDRPQLAVSQLKHREAPGKARPGYTRRITIHEPVVCARCNLELGAGLEDKRSGVDVQTVSREQIQQSKRVFFSKCGHVYCGSCVGIYTGSVQTTTTTTTTTGGQRKRRRTEPRTCAVDDCKQSFARLKNPFREVFY